MYFVNRGLSSFLVVFLVASIIILGFLFLVNVLPYLLILGAGVWGISYIVKRIKKWNNHKSNAFNVNTDKASETVEEDYIPDLSEANIIDVEYTEVK